MPDRTTDQFMAQLSYANEQRRRPDPARKHLLDTVAGFQPGSVFTTSAVVQRSQPATGKSWAWYSTALEELAAEGVLRAEDGVGRYRVDTPDGGTMPDVFELIATIKDMHHKGGGACKECGQPWPCRTFAYADGLLSARFDDGQG